MEPKKQNQTSIIAAVVIAVLALLCAILACLSSMPNGIKCRAALLIIAASGAVIAALMKPRAGGAELRELYEIRTKLQQTETELRKSRQNADALQQQLTQVSRAFPADTALLQEKCEAIEAFRNSFPYRISDTYVIFAVLRTELVPSSHSRWQIVGQIDNDLWEYSLLRPDTQSYKKMLCLVGSTKAPNKLKELNQSDTLLWR